MPDEETRLLSLYEGRNLLGHVQGVGRIWCAFDAAGNTLPGEFRSYGAAAAAGNTARANPCAADDRLDGTP